MSSNCVLETGGRLRRANRSCGEREGRVASKLDEIVTVEWSGPLDYLEPLQGPPHEKLRSGPFRLGCRADRHRTNAVPSVDSKTWW
ncbi:cytotoxic translational repressor of toxin-antitoxin stability system [Halanaeroarchaeum sulfurireducens]|uniref:Cytotoxic translational repressor of toxin-antitoxin stability system n=1 Tax=Halanaeroarchaeum sulfurireducens TaxID=1604004 RepID=A0A0F7PA93_9EURY|nr:cytotoxic translational repressor of toxin-antitoxin stability system [Halanaeroarchaeum sulfurireducens]ALG80941.1 cytotoxic translational repressor of toxin-antitoxin stability system [Halanaeroarchaeum sulfurireducens]